MRAVCLICENPLRPRRGIPFAPCKTCRKWQQVVLIDEDKDQNTDSHAFSSYMINLFVDAKTGICSLLTSEGCFKFPLGKRYDSWALEQMLYAASIDFNSDYVSEEHIISLAQSAAEGVFFQMRSLGIRKIKGARTEAKHEKAAEVV